MREALVATLAILSILLVFSVASAAPVAPDYTNVGVKVGDKATYRSYFSYTLNTTHVLVHGIIGTTIFLNFSHYYSDGTLYGWNQEVGDIYSGTGFMAPYVIPAELTVGDPISFGGSLVISDAAQLTVAGALRTINHLSAFGGNLEVYWDRATGLMTELHFLEGIHWYNYTMVSTTAWSPATSPGLLNMATIALVEGVVIIVLVVVLIVISRRSRRS